VLEDLSKFGLSGEPIIRDSISAGADVVSFSGDKLLGSAQAGLIVGRAKIVERLRRHSLYRALRADKLSLAALEATLESHLRGAATEEVPALHMLSMSREEIEDRAKNILRQLGAEPQTSGLSAELTDGESAIGGGSGPNTHPATTLIALTHQELSADEIEQRLRRFSPPVISRIADGKVLLDLRTVEPEAEPELLHALKSLKP
jgi:L-seryl-tRNA(Ser) seleniumtransferase